MSLLDDVSIVVTPNGYKAGELYAVIPVPTEGAELVTDSDFLLTGTQAENTTGTYWTTGDGWSISGGKAVAVVGTSSRLEQSISGLSGKYCKINLTLSDYGGGGSIYIDFGSTNSSLINTNGEHTVYGTFDQNKFEIFKGGAFSGSIYNLSVKEYTSADMDVTRNTAATRVDENGLVNYAEVIGDSILTGNNSNFDTGIGSWVGYNGGTLAHSTDKLQVTLTTGESGARINTNGLISGGQAGKTFKVRARVWQGTTTSTTLKIYIGGNQENINISSTPTYFEVELIPPNSGDLFIYRGGSGDTGTYFIDDVTVKEVTRDNVPRIDYTGGGCPHILAEPMRTNLIPYSEDLTDAFYLTTGIGTVTESATLSPDGTSYGYTITPTSSATNHYFNYNYGELTVVIGDEVTYSIFVKPNGYNFIQIATSTGFAGKYQNFELTGNGVIGTGDVNGKTIEKIGDWYRCSVTETSTGVNPRFLLIPSPTALATRNPVYSGNGTDGVLGWGVQVEVGSYATSYIPNFGTALGVTRNQDIFTRDGIGSLINSTEGVLFVEMAALSDDLTYRRISLSDSTEDNRISISYDDVSNTISGQVFVGGVEQSLLTYVLSDITEFSKIALKYKVNDFELWIDGYEIATGVSGSVFPQGTLNSLSFDNGSSVQNFFGKVKQLQVYDTTLTVSQLENLTV